MPIGQSLMKPISRGRAPAEYVLRVPCYMPREVMATDTGGSMASTLLEGVPCELSLIPTGFLITARGFDTAADAEHYFYRLARMLLRNSMAARIPFTIDATQLYPQQRVAMFAGNTVAEAAGWPNEAAQYIVLDSFRAQIYPEHEFVVAGGAFRMHPVVEKNVSELARLLLGGPIGTTGGAIDQRLQLAIFAYTHGARSFERVWGFLQVTMALEMLAQLVGIHGGATARFIHLVEQFCAPGVATLPLLTHYSTLQECTEKADAMYDLRSRYVHDGYVQTVKHGYAFDPLFDAAHATLGHIVEQLL